MLNKKYKLKTSALVVGLMLCCSAVFAAEPAEGVQFVKYDRPANVSVMPANFRTAQSQYKQSKTGVKASTNYRCPAAAISLKMNLKKC